MFLLKAFTRNDSDEICDRVCFQLQAVTSFFLEFLILIEFVYYAGAQLGIFWKVVQSLQKCRPPQLADKGDLVCRAAKAVYFGPFSMGFHVLQPIVFGRGDVLSALGPDWGMGRVLQLLRNIVVGNMKFLDFLDLSNFLRS